ncbi:MAG TPA: FG-GAP-like repeat-containing protein [Acidobacteriaceae bacterium]|nr:FG-GAP-like repeat-containing protein [Acidobacteriaceae bacterium]
MAPVLFTPAPLFRATLLFGQPEIPARRSSALTLPDARLTPHYPEESPLADILRLVAPGSDDYPTEKYAFEIEALLREWGQSLTTSVRNTLALEKFLSPSVVVSPISQFRETALRKGYGVEVVMRHFDSATVSGRNRFLHEVQTWLGHAAHIETAEFEIYGIEQTGDSPLAVRTQTRYDVVIHRSDGRREERVGAWKSNWTRDSSGSWTAHRWEADEETVAVSHGPVFIDVSEQALGAIPSYKDQIIYGADYWRTVLDGACGIDLYNNTGVAAGDFDNDGVDDLYICQPAGLPNRLYRNRGDGTFEDVTETAGVAVLDNTACALFADLRNVGLQDLLVVCSTGPLLFLNQGNGTFVRKPDAFRFRQQPQGSFTHAAVADYDRDGRLDIYFCTYMYYLGLDQYHYPVPYYDAQNGPPNCLFHNEGNATFVETTQAAGMNADNNRYSFACAWGDYNSNGHPDLFVANDFGSSQLFRNNGDGTFTAVSKDAHVEDVGAGMGCSWADFDNDGLQDVYVPSMWEAAGQRVSGQKQFHPEATPSIRALYQRHAKGNALYRNLGNGAFENIGRKAGVEMGRWSWSADFLDFDHDGYPDLYVTNGYISGSDRNDVASFFWRQVVAKSPDDASSSPAYERGWNAINELIRSDSTWHGYARHVMFVNNRDGSFAEASGPSGLDFDDDGRAFALADIDHDGRLEIILKNRNAPQLRVLHNVMPDIGNSIVFRLRGHTSNRDAIGTAITIETDSLRQTKYLQAGSGFLSQHSKELFFGLGTDSSNIRATVRWPNGLVQHFTNLPENHRIQLEEGHDTFTARPFASPPSSYEKSGPAFKPKPLPLQVETWLIEPLKAPAFSLPDLNGKLHELQKSQGSLVLLNFWTTTSPASLDQLRDLRRQLPAFKQANLQVLAVNVDEPGALASARSFATQADLPFPVLFATEEIAGVYNIIYRYLFDRRRDLPIPASFLLDKNGMIVKIYQGLAAPQQLLDDARYIPATPAERMSKALPFKGQLVQDEFVRNDFTYGVALFQHGYFDQAEESFQQVVAAKPGSAEGYYNLGTLSLRRGDLDQARTYLEKTVKLRPDYPEAWNNLGMIAAQQGRTDDAVRNFRQALTLQPDYATALLNLGNLYRRQGDFQKAEQSLEQALHLHPNDPEVNYSVGMLGAQIGQTQIAEQYLQKAISLKPDYAEALNNLGVLYVHMQDFQNAEAQFKICIRRAPNFDQSYLNLASLYAMQGKMAQAREVIQKLLRIDPGNPAAAQALQMLK